MGKSPAKELVKFLRPFDDEIKSTVLWLRNFVWEIYPTSNELIYDNYNALALGWSISDRLGHVFCNIAIGRTSHNIHFGFFWGTEIADPEKRLIGEGNQYRYLLVRSINTFPKTYIKKLLKASYANSKSKVKDERQIVQGKTFIKSISAKKRGSNKMSARKKSKPF